MRTAIMLASTIHCVLRSNSVTTFSKNRTWLLAVFALGLMTAFLILNIHDLHMHPDEELSYRSTNGDLAYIIHYQQSLQDNQAPLWFLTFGAWRTFAGDAEFTSRMLGILLAMLALSFLYRIGRGGSGSRLTGVFAILVLIGNAFFFQYALDIRPYPMTMLSAAISIFALQRWITRQRPRDAVYCGLSIALVLYVHYLLIFLILVQALYVVIFVRMSRRLILQGFAATALGACLFLPWLPTFVAQVNGIRAGEAVSGAARGLAGIGVSTQITSAQTIGDLLMMATNGLPLLYGAIVIFGVVRLWKNRAFWLAIFWAFLAPAVYLLANLIVAVYAPRFVSSSMLGFGLVLGAALLAFPAGIHTIRIGWIALGVLVGIQLVTFSAQLPDRIPYRDIFRAISVSAEPDDAVLMFQAGENDGFVHWQRQHYLSPNLNQNVTTDISQAQVSRRLWFITGNLLTEDAQAIFSDLEVSHPVQQVIGDCNRQWCYVAQLMEAPPLDTPLIFGGETPFYGIDVDAVTPESIQARLWWKAVVSPQADYSIGLHLLDSSGRLVAQNDGAINHYGAELVQTSQMRPDQIYMDVRELALPADLPADTYRLALVVYKSSDGTRLTLPDGTDYLMLQTITIP